ncbi:MAG: hypothetical protein SFZ23_00390 [Planctomycetota bacterium]|nr:hypothetical protein [Planctomycetota bacterium]
MLALSAWTIVASNLPKEPRFSGASEQPQSPDYWKLFDEEASRSDIERFRSFALYASVFTTGILAVVVVIQLRRREPVAHVHIHVESQATKEAIALKGRESHEGSGR